MLFEPLFTHAQQTPQDIAIIDEKGRYTYQQLAAAAGGLGMYLGMQTDKPNVGLLLPPSAGFAASFYGTLISGKSVVPINYLLGDREIAHVIADSGIDRVVTIPQLAPRIKVADLKVVDPTQLPQNRQARPPQHALQATRIVGGSCTKRDRLHKLAGQRLASGGAPRTFRRCPQQATCSFSPIRCNSREFP